MIEKLHWQPQFIGVSRQDRILSNYLSPNEFRESDRFKKPLCEVLSGENQTEKDINISSSWQLLPNQMSGRNHFPDSRS
jgi:hypothetical protein